MESMSTNISRRRSYYPMRNDCRRIQGVTEVMLVVAGMGRIQGEVTGGGHRRCVSWQ
jgi:hypothetical protein